MEDAVIHELNIGDGNSLFAVFDGHGGNHQSIQDLKSAGMCPRSSSRSSKRLRSIRRKSMPRHSI